MKDEFEKMEKKMEDIKKLGADLKLKNPEAKKNLELLKEGFVSSILTKFLSNI